MKTYKIFTLGCKVNQYDSNVLSGKMIAAGFSLVKNNADIVIINTCAVTKNAIKKDKAIVAEAKKENSRAKIIVIGCWPKVYGNEIKKIQADKISTKKDWDELVGEIFQFLKIKRRDSMSPRGLLESSRSRYTIKIQDGCEQFCSYCVIPYARGKLQSRPAEEVLREIKAAVAAGYEEIVLCGIHLGLYGREKDTRCPIGHRVSNCSNKKQENLTNLLKKIIKIKNFGRIRLSSIEVTEVSAELIKLMADSDKICGHLHIPLQSGNDKILKLMNRPYEPAYFRKKVQELRKVMPDIALTTDVIVGFPEETEADFKKTYEFIKEINFSRLHVFPFSAHEKTPAFFMKNKVSREKTAARAKKLRELSRKLENNYRKKFVGKELEVVVENKKGDRHNGKTEYYFDVEFKMPPGRYLSKGGKANRAKDLVGKIIKIKI